MPKECKHAGQNLWPAGIAATFHNYHNDDMRSFKFPGSMMWDSEEHARAKAFKICIAFIDMVGPHDVYTPS